MRVAIILAGLVTLFSTTTGAPGYSGGLGFCFDDTDCRAFGGQCTKENGNFVGKCLGGQRIPGQQPSAPSNIIGSPTVIGSPMITGSPAATGSGAAQYANDIGAIASRVAQRTDLPAEITAFAKSIANRPEYATKSSSQSKTYSGWRSHKTAAPSPNGGGWKAW